MSICVVYRGGYKYQLIEPFFMYTKNVCPDAGITEHEWIVLAEGWLTIRSGYAWDGPSGPTLDTDSFMRGSLVHDALYQLIRDGLLPQACRKDADAELYRLIRKDGMGRLRAGYVYCAVRWFAANAAVHRSARKIAPRHCRFETSEAAG